MTAPNSKFIPFPPKARLRGYGTRSDRRSRAAVWAGSIFRFLCWLFAAPCAWHAIAAVTTPKFAWAALAACVLTVLCGALIAESAEPEIFIPTTNRKDER
jgi:hypothetical protein